MLDLLGDILGYVMRLCYSIFPNYGVAIIFFVFITKIILLPISIWVHNNGIKLVKMQPEINFLKANHYGDNDYIAEEQSKINKRGKYNPFASLIPLAIQIILLMGIVQVIYNPMTYILNLPDGLIASMISLASNLAGVDISTNSIQLYVLEAVKNAENLNAFLSLQGNFPDLNMQSVLDSLSTIDMDFIGISLSWVPSTFRGVTMLVPLIAAFSSWLQCFTQNKSSVLQSEQGKLNKYGTMVLSVSLSLYLGWFVPVGVALYWVSSIIFSIIQMYILNVVISPKKHIDYDKLQESRKALAEINDLDTKNMNSILESVSYMLDSSNFKDNGQFTMFHIECPHTPFVFDEHGRHIDYENYMNWSDKKYYFGQFKYSTKLMLEIVDSIVKRDPNCIIILQSDHGARQGIGGRVDPKSDMHCILNAVYFTGEAVEEIEGLSGVNTMRLVLNKLFDTNYDIVEMPEDTYAY